MIADTPGFSALEFNDLTKEEVAKTFLDFKKSDCAFKNCLHLKEEDCGVKKLVAKGKILPSRYESYLKIIKETGDKR